MENINSIIYSPNHETRDPQPTTDFERTYQTLEDFLNNFDYGVEPMPQPSIGFEAENTIEPCLSTIEREGIQSAPGFTQNGADYNQQAPSNVYPQPVPTQNGADYNQQAPNYLYPPPMGQSGSYVPQHFPYHPMATHTENGNSVVPGSMSRPVGFFNGQKIQQYLPEPSTSYSSASSAPCARTSGNRQRDEEEDKPYIKKPLNAFMLFRAEQREKIMAELNIRNSATVNAVLGERWRMLSAEVRAVYIEKAYKVRKAHEAKYPEWSVSDNFGKKVKRRRTKTTTNNNQNTAPVQGNHTTMILPPTYQAAPTTMVLPPTYHAAPTTMVLPPTYQAAPTTMVLPPTNQVARSYTGPVTWQAPKC